jgi:hypothetical protein
MVSTKQRAFRGGNADAPASRHYLFFLNLKALSGIRTIGLEHRNRKMKVDTKANSRGLT